MKGLAAVLGIVAAVIFIVIPVAINLITKEFTTGGLIATISLGLVVVVIPVALILGAVPTTVAVTARMKRKSRIENEASKNNDSPE